ncbi:excalibur calcium-binding domain-containing protein [Mycobacterium sp. NPDC051804]|uniref:excalibur calcium-binding domain-containing protein n=1 Tax=Mycobacterium sp. NPDC051804 TaxID=3364295 RepID=UPI0037AECC51
MFRTFIAAALVAAAAAVGAASVANADTYYKNCDAARDAGAAPVHEGDPGYGPHLDRDRDGVGCE